MVHRAKRSRWVNFWHWFVLKLFKRSAEWSISCRRVHEHKRTWVCFSAWESTLPIGQICTSSWQINNACQLKVKKLLNRLNFIHLHGFPFIFTGFAVSGSMLHLKAKNFQLILHSRLPLAGIRTGNDDTRWASLQTTLAQRLPEDMEEKIVQFNRFIVAARQRVGYPLSRIYNTDETPMRFELPSTRSLEFTGSWTVPVKTGGPEKWSFTVTLADAADGTKLPPKVIFKGV